MGFFYGSKVFQLMKTLLLKCQEGIWLNQSSCERVHVPLILKEIVIVGFFFKPII